MKRYQEKDSRKGESFLAGGDYSKKNTRPTSREESREIEIERKSFIINANINDKLTFEILRASIFS